MVVYAVKISENYGLHSAERGKKKGNLLFHLFFNSELWSWACQAVILLKKLLMGLGHFEHQLCSLTHLPVKNNEEQHNNS